MPRPGRAFAATVALALALGAGLAAEGCGGGDDMVTVTGRTLRLELDEYRIRPQDVKVQSGRLRVVAHNVGRLTHNVKVLRQADDDLEAPPEEMGGTRTAQPGETVAYTFERLPPGTYRLACTIANHDDLGQYGKLVVQEPPSR